MNNFDDLFPAGGEKKETKSERSFNKEEWAAKKQQERTDAFELLDTATKEAVENCETFRDKMIAGVMAAVLATQGTAWASAWALAVGFGLNIFLSNWDPRKKSQENVIEEKTEK